MDQVNIIATMMLSIPQWGVRQMAFTGIDCVFSCLRFSATVYPETVPRALDPSGQPNYLMEEGEAAAILVKI
jgi:hypothetical protein